MTEPVRAALSTDLHALEYLQAQARAGVLGQRGGAAWLDETPPIDWPASLDDTLVAEYEGVVVGFLRLTVDDRTAHVRVYVEPGARELGLGGALVEAAIERARAAGCRAIQGFALPGDRETKNLFERNGLVARKIIVSRAL